MTSRTFGRIGQLGTILSALVVAVIAAVAVALAVAAGLGASPADRQALTILLPGAAVSALAIGGIGIALALRAPRLGIGGKLALGQVMVVVVALTNVGLTAGLMFISPHDLGLLTGVLAVSAIVSLLYAAVVARWLTASIRDLGRAADAIAAGALDTRVTVRTGDELETLATAFNMMAERLEAARQREQHETASRRELIQAVSHDLRTPLAALRAVIDALADGVVSDEPTVRRYLMTAQGETDRLGTLVGDLFQLSQIEAGAVDLRREPAAIDDLVSDVVTSLQPAAAARSVRLDGEAEPGLRAVVDVSRIERVLRNLIDNAIAHSPAGGAVHIRAAGSAGDVIIAVEDEGSGIADIDLPRIFDRFYRSEASRQRATSAGAGLGLAIARGFVEAHGGTIAAANRQPAGAVFQVRLPAR